MSYNNLIAFLLAVSFIVALGIAGNGDVANELHQDEEYCSMVAGGHWPPFNPNIHCKE